MKLRLPLANDPSTGVANIPALPASRFYLHLVGFIWAVALLIVCVRVAISPHRQSSYAADYAPAGWHWLHGQEVYGRQRSFVYSPLVAAAFSPLAALPDRLGGIVWRLGCVAAVLGTAVAWLRRRRTLGPGEVAAPSARAPATVTGCLLLLPLAIGNINLGQMNLLVLAAVTGAILAVQGRRWNLAALLLAAAGFMKIYPLAIGLLLALLYPREFSWRLLLGVVVLFVASLILQNPAYVWGEYHQWFALLGRDDRLDISLYASWRDFGFLLRACGIPLSDHAYRLMEAAAGGLLALFLWCGKWRWSWTEPRLLNGVYTLGCAWMLLFGPATEQATYVLLALPVCAALTIPGDSSVIGAAARATRLRWVSIFVYALLLFAEISSSWFHGSTHHLYVRAVEPVATLIFAAATAWSLLQEPLSDSAGATSDSLRPTDARG